jgi:hypothetical protein
MGARGTGFRRTTGKRSIDGRCLSVGRAARGRTRPGRNTVAVFLVALAVMAAWSASASADMIHFTFFKDFGIPQPASTPAGGFYNVVFNGGSAVSGAIERGGVVIATAPPAPPGSGINGASVLEATLQSGDIAHLSDPNVAGGLTATFTGYPTIAQAQCGATTISGGIAPGQPVVYVRYDTGFGSLGKVGAVTNTGGGYSVTFPIPLPPGAIVYVTSFYTQPQPQLEVETQFEARTTSPCLEAPPPPPPVPVVKCVVPNLKHKTLARARQLLARAHCKLGKILKPKRHTNHKLVVVSQKPGAKRIMAAGSKVSVRLGGESPKRSIEAVRGQSAASAPTTVSQCKQKYKKSTKKRAACIKRVNKPGSSCAHPFFSEATSYGNGGDKADFTVELGQYDPNSRPFTPVQVYAIVTIHNPRVVICPKVTFIDEPEGPASLHRYYATVGPEGGSTSTITVPLGRLVPVAYARLK